MTLVQEFFLLVGVMFFLCLQSDDFGAYIGAIAFIKQEKSLVLTGFHHWKISEITGQKCFSQLRAHRARIPFPAGIASGPVN